MLIVEFVERTHRWYIAGIKPNLISDSKCWSCCASSVGVYFLNQLGTIHLGTEEIENLGHDRGEYCSTDVRLFGLEVAGVDVKVCCGV